jgi:hypothetical protein
MTGPIPELYCALIQEYMNYTLILKNPVSTEYIYIGWRTMSHVFNLIVAKHPDDLKKIYEVTRNAYLIYLEYIDQMRSAIQKDTSDLSSAFNYNSAVIFVYSKLNDELRNIPPVTHEKHNSFQSRIPVMKDDVKTGIIENPGGGKGEGEGGGKGELSVPPKEFLFCNMIAIADLIFVWNHPLITNGARKTLIDKHLSKYISKVHNIEKIRDILEKHEDWGLDEIDAVLSSSIGR